MNRISLWGAAATGGGRAGAIDFLCSSYRGKSLRHLPTLLLLCSFAPYFAFLCFAFLSFIFLLLLPRLLSSLSRAPRALTAEPSRLSLGDQAFCLRNFVTGEAGSRKAARLSLGLFAWTLHGDILYWTLPGYISWGHLPGLCLGGGGREDA